MNPRVFELGDLIFFLRARNFLKFFNHCSFFILNIP